MSDRVNASNASTSRGGRGAGRGRGRGGAHGNRTRQQKCFFPGCKRPWSHETADCWDAQKQHRGTNNAGASTAPPGKNPAATPHDMLSPASQKAHKENNDLAMEMSDGCINCTPNGLAPGCNNCTIAKAGIGYLPEQTPTACAITTTGKMVSVNNPQPTVTQPVFGKGTVAISDLGPSSVTDHDPAAIHSPGALDGPVDTHYPTDDQTVYVGTASYKHEIDEGVNTHVDFINGVLQEAQSNVFLKNQHFDGIKAGVHEIIDRLYHDGLAEITSRDIGITQMQQERTDDKKTIEELQRKLEEAEAKRAEDSEYIQRINKANEGLRSELNDSCDAFKNSKLRMERKEDLIQQLESELNMYKEQERELRAALEKRDEKPAADDAEADQASDLADGFEKIEMGNADDEWDNVEPDDSE